MTFLLALMIAVVFYISANLIDFNLIEYATGFVFGLSFTLIFKKQSKSSKAAELLNKHVKEWAVRESRRGGGYLLQIKIRRILKVAKNVLKTDQKL